MAGSVLSQQLGHGPPSAIKGGYGWVQSYSTVGRRNRRGNCWIPEPVYRRDRRVTGLGCSDIVYLMQFSRAA